jgi:ubiquinone/menaquinone biosynthesis methyltransferases
MIDKKDIGATFDNIAPRYDFLNHFLSLNIDKSWRKKAVACISCVKQQKVLDIATGTADFAIELLKQNPDRKITGIDLSSNMLSMAMVKLKNLGIDSVDLEQMSALKMSFVSESFDCVTCAFGVRNFSDINKGLSEIYRVLKHGGECVVLEFSKPKKEKLSFFSRLFWFGYSFYLNHILSFVGKIISHNKEAYSYLPSSIKSFPYPDEFAKMLTNSGFYVKEIKPLTLSIVTIYVAKKQ